MKFLHLKPFVVILLGLLLPGVLPAQAGLLQRIDLDNTPVLPDYLLKDTAATTDGYFLVYEEAEHAHLDALYLYDGRKLTPILLAEDIDFLHGDGQDLIYAASLPFTNRGAYLLDGQTQESRQIADTYLDLRPTGGVNNPWPPRALGDGRLLFRSGDELVVSDSPLEEPLSLIALEDSRGSVYSYTHTDGGDLLVANEHLYLLEPGSATLVDLLTVEFDGALMGVRSEQNFYVMDERANIYVTNGTAAGSRQVHKYVGPTPGGPWRLGALRTPAPLAGGRMWFHGGPYLSQTVLYTTDGTAAGTRPIINPESEDFFTYEATDMWEDGNRYFSRIGDTISRSYRNKMFREYWISDGTRDGTHSILRSDTSKIRDLFRNNNSLNNRHAVEIDVLATLGGVTLITADIPTYVSGSVEDKPSLWAYRKDHGWRKLVSDEIQVLYHWPDGNNVLLKGEWGRRYNFNAATFTLTELGGELQPRFFEVDGSFYRGGSVLLADYTARQWGQSVQWIRQSGPLAKPELLGDFSPRVSKDKLLLLPFEDRVDQPVTVGGQRFAGIYPVEEVTYRGKLMEYDGGNAYALESFADRLALVLDDWDSDSVHVIADGSATPYRTRVPDVGAVVFGGDNIYANRIEDDRIYLSGTDYDSVSFTAYDRYLRQPKTTIRPAAPEGHEYRYFQPFEADYYFLDNYRTTCQQEKCEVVIEDGREITRCELVTVSCELFELVRYDPVDLQQSIVRSDTIKPSGGSDLSQLIELDLSAGDNFLYYSLPNLFGGRSEDRLVRSDGTSEGTVSVARQGNLPNQPYRLATVYLAAYSKYGAIVGVGRGRGLRWAPHSDTLASLVPIGDLRLSGAGFAVNVIDIEDRALMTVNINRLDSPTEVFELSDRGAIPLGELPRPVRKNLGQLSPAAGVVALYDHTVWKIDGERGLLEQLVALDPPYTYEAPYVLLNGKLYYYDEAENGQVRLMYYDIEGATVGTVVADKDVVRFVSPPVVAGGTLYLTAESTVHGEEVYYLDATGGRLISGHLYADTDRDDAFDGDERGLSGQLVSLSSTVAAKATTDSSGYYEFFAPASGKLVVSVEDSGCGAESGFGENNRVELREGEGEQTVNFGFKSDDRTASVELLLSASRLRCGFTVPYWITVNNISCSAFTGPVTFQLPEGSSYVSSETEPTSVTTEAVSWQVNDLLPLAQRRIRVEVRMPDETFIGSIVAATAYTGSGDDDDSARTEHTQPLSCAYDPNDKKVVPSRSDPDSRNYTLYDEALTYTVRFQNTGNDTAFTVRIVDDLSRLLDHSTVEPLDASHPYTFSVSKEGRIEYTFANILLVDSTRNEPGSHGFLRLRVSPRPGVEKLGEATVIENTAAIYFDFNRPIITNTTKNTLVPTLDGDQDGSYFWNDCDDADAAIYPGATDTSGNGIDENCDGADGTTAVSNWVQTGYSVYPNPTSGSLLLQLNRRVDVVVKLYTMTGRLLMTEELSTEKLLDLKEFPRGTYVLRILSTSDNNSLPAQTLVVKQ